MKCKSCGKEIVFLRTATGKAIPVNKETVDAASVRALRAYYSPEEIKQAAMSATNKAFERYMGRDSDDAIRTIYQQGAAVVKIGSVGKELVRDSAR